MPRRLNSFELSMLAGVVLVILVALLLSADDGGNGEGAGDRVLPPDPRRTSLSPSRVRLIARRVERLRELRFKEPVRPLFLTRARAARLMAELTKAEYSDRERQIDEEELRLLGLLRPSDDLDEALEAVEEEEILGFYDDRSERLVVIRGGGQSRALLEVTLAHELVHALEDQHFTFRALRGLSDDAALAESALAEGTATELMIEYATRHLEPGRLLDLALGAIGPDTDLPAYVEKALLFPYEEGQEFVAGFRSGRGGWGAVDKVLRLRHPRSSEQVLHPEKYAVDERPVRIPKAELSDLLGRGWRRLDATSVGEVDLRALFEIVGGRPAARAAAGWGGGLFELWRLRAPDDGECASPCIARDVGVLRLRWDRNRDRAEAEERLPRVFEHGLKARRARPREGLGLWLSRGGAIAMAGRGRETSIVLAPTARIAARVLLSGRI